MIKWNAQDLRNELGLDGRRRVADPAVLEQLLAVVGHENDDRLFEHALLLENAHDLADCPIHDLEVLVVQGEDQRTVAWVK